MPRVGRALAGFAFAGSLLVPGVEAQSSRDTEDLVVALGWLKRGLHDEAAAKLTTFLREHPQHERAAEAWYRLGTCRTALGDNEGAVEAFRTCLQDRRPFKLRAECQYRLGGALVVLKQHEQALAAFGAMRQGVADDHYLAVPCAYGAAECLRELGRDAAAAAAFLAVAKADRSEDGGHAAPALYQAGFALLRQEEFEQAADAFAAVTQRFPRHEAAAECRQLEGEAAFRAGALPRAEAAYTRARAAGGEWADDAVMGLAWCALEDGRDAQALARFRELLRDHVDSALAPKARLESGRILYRGGDYDAALDELEPLASNGAEGPRAEALELQGLSLLESGRAEPASARFSQALAIAEPATDKARLLYNLGESLAELEQWSGALDAYRRAEPDAAGELVGEVRYGQCLALHKLGRYAESIERAEALLNAQPEHRLGTHAQFAIGENYFAAERWTDADAAYGRVPTDHELGLGAQFKRAWCAFLGGKAPVAAERFGALAADGPFAEEALSMTALARLEAENNDAALTAADQYRARYPKGGLLARTERVAARVLRARGDLRGASARLAAAAAAESSADQAARDRLEEAELYFQQGDFEGADERYLSLREREDEVGLQAIEGLAWCAFELGDDDACLQRVGEALARADADARRPGLLELALSVHHRREQWQDAERTARQFLGQFPDHERANEVRFGLGVALARAEKHSDAREVLAGLAEVADSLEDPARVFYEWAWASRRDGDEDAALECFAEVAERAEDPDRRGEAHLHLGLADLEREERAAARAHFAQVQGRHRPQALYRTGFTWLDEEQPDTARAAFAAIEELGDTELLYWDATFLVGECGFLAENYELAAGRYRKLLEADPDHVRAQPARLHGGQSMVRLSQPGEAATVLEDFLRRGSEDRTEQAEANLWLGKARIARQEWDRAEAALQKVTELSEGELAAEAQYRIGEARRARGDLRNAVDAFVKLSILYAHEEWVRRGLLQAGDCYLELEQPAKATRFLAELVERFPDSAEAGVAQQRLKDL
ncbi:MAG: tetratricopeptide repeat protein [Planctomycetota bacterium]